MNGDGQMFISKDHRTEIIASGSNAEEDIETFQQEYQNAINGITVTYKIVNKSSFIFSGVDQAGRIIYQKTVKRKISNSIQGDGPVFQTWMITYPPSDSITYKTYCYKIAKSFE